MESLMASSDEAYLQIIKSKLPASWEQRKHGLTVFLNPYSYLKMRKERETLSNVDNICIDGVMLCSFLKYILLRKVSRHSFDYTSIADDVFRRAKLEGQTVAIVGSTEFYSQEFCNKILKRYSGIKTVYCRNGFFTTSTERDVCIKQCRKADIVICGMGTPLQEIFINDLKKSGFTGNAYTCGGFIHQTASKEQEYYQTIINKLNLRAIYRMYDEPKLIRRYLIEYPKFVFLFIKDAFELKSREGKNEKS